MWGLTGGGDARASADEAGDPPDRLAVARLLRIVPRNPVEWRIGKLLRGQNVVVVSECEQLGHERVEIRHDRNVALATPLRDVAGDPFPAVAAEVPALQEAEFFATEPRADAEESDPTLPRPSSRAQEALGFGDREPVDLRLSCLGWARLLSRVVFAEPLPDHSLVEAHQHRAIAALRVRVGVAAKRPLDIVSAGLAGVAVAHVVGVADERVAIARLGAGRVDLAFRFRVSDVGQAIAALAELRACIDELETIAGRLARSAVAHGGCWGDVASSLRLDPGQARSAYAKDAPP